MRVITKKAVNAFKAGKPFNGSNTTVEVREGETFLYLFGNMIAHRYNNGGNLFISTCGWRTNTTKERLNGLLMAFDLPTINQSNFVWYINGEEFTGTKIFEIDK